ncbi:hypothetical protein QVD17_35592 [Tagetes erecta]|uniref:Late embryogenesis abundant protein LEA-2 subgroup domain-containing protein n=1 Tax=Tagetes erecta TaxID=13708 RepID=A0AAD8NLD4_TARER|nr:hypothetical protein QVD17_42270 [Tagetes erecta]KAK1413809.1 hypothetical protein QVD17_35592 [Tagetes erecta]
MFQSRETNPHFQPRQQRYAQPHHPDSPNALASQVPQRFRPSPPSESPPPVAPLLPHSHQPSSHLPISSPGPVSGPRPEPGSRPEPEPVLGPRPGSRPGQVFIPPRAPPHSRPSPITHQGTPTSHYLSPPIRVPPPRKTKGLTWLVAICCVLFWIIVILGGLILLIVYLAYRPRYPKFDITSASLNAAYLDLGYLYNGDLTLLANFTNPNKKVSVEFRYMVINLYFEGTLIGARYVEPLSVSPKGYRLRDVHLVSSQVPFSRTHVAHLNEQMRLGRIMFEVKSYLRTTSTLGGFFRYSYWLYGHCKFVMSGPPSGIMVVKSCVTKR